MTVDDLIHAVQQLQREVAILATATRQANAAPVPVPAPATTHTLPPRPGNPTAGAANHLSNILNGGSHVVAPHAPPQPILPPEVMARYTDDQKAYVDAFRSLGPMGAFHMHLQPPNLNNYKNDHAYIWPGHALIASHPGGNNPRTL